MVTAILPTMTYVKAEQDPRSPSRHSGSSHTLNNSISSELTITPTRLQAQRPSGGSQDSRKGASASHLAGMVGMFTGCGALVALLLFLPLPTRFQKAGHSPATAVADAFYVVGTIAIVVAIAVFFGLRNLPGEEGKGLRRLFGRNAHKPDQTQSPAQAYVYWPQHFWESIKLGFTSRNIGLGYLGGFVARASSVAISLYIPLFTNTYFLRTGLCAVDPDDPSDIKHGCPRAYKLAAALTGVSQLFALICAPLFGSLSARYPRYNVPLLTAALAGVAGYAAFGTLPSPDPRSDDGTGAVFPIVCLLGISQIGAIVCSLGLLARGIHNEKLTTVAENESVGTITPSANTALDAENADLERPALALATEDAPLLGQPLSTPSSPASNDLNHLKGSIAGTYSLFGGLGILLLTKAGGALFDSTSPGAPFFMMAAFNALLLVVGVASGVHEAYQVWEDENQGE